MTQYPEHAEIMNRVQNVFRDVFDDDTLKISETTSAADIPDWDSIMHITLCVALEREFAVRLNAIEIASLSDVGKLVELLERRTA